MELSVDLFGAGSRHQVGVYNSHLRVSTPEATLVEALSRLPSHKANDSVTEADEIPQQTVAALNLLLHHMSSIRRVGPIVAFYRESVDVESDFREIRFFGSDENARWKAPNKVFINLGQRDVEMEVALPDSARIEHEKSKHSPSQHSANDPDSPLRIALKPSSAASVPVDFVPHRFDSPGELLVLHGYFTL